MLHCLVRQLPPVRSGVVNLPSHHLADYGLIRDFPRHLAAGRSETLARAGNGSRLGPGHDERNGKVTSVAEDLRGVQRPQHHPTGHISSRRPRPGWPPSVFVLSQQALGDTSVVVGYGVVRFQANRLGAVGDGVFVLPQRALGGTPVSVGLRVIRLQTKRFVIVGDGVFVSPQLVLGSTPVVVGPRVVRFQANRLGTVGNGVFVSPQRALGGTPVSVGSA